MNRKDQAKPKIAITIRSFDLDGSAMQRLREHCDVVYVNTTSGRLSEKDLGKILAGADGVIAGTEKITGPVMEQAGTLRVISRVGVGLDSIDLEAAKQRGIVVKNTPEAPAVPVAEHTVALIFALLKNIPLYNARMRSGDFSILPASTLQGKTVGIVGIGRIGSGVGRLLECAGCRIRFYDPFVKPGFPASWERAATPEELVAGADILTIHTGPLPSGKPLIEEKLLSRAKKGIIIINTARGSLFDEAALCAALESGRIAGAALDVFSVEPYTGGLLRFPQVIVTPHVASNTREARLQMEEEAVSNLIEALDVKR